MARTPSTMAPLGSAAVDFSLPDTDGKTIRMAALSTDKPLLLMFICNHCPFVKHVAAELAAIGRDYQSRVHIIAINSNDAEKYPEDSPEKMKIEIAERGYTFSYVFDGTQQVARAYQAACTPDFFLFDGERKLFYRGQLDESRPGNAVKVSGADLRAALDSVLAKKKPPVDQRPSMGCNIKWK